jgi:hypothetical protein
MPAIIDSVVRTLDGFADCSNVMYEGIPVLGEAAAFVLCATHASQEAASAGGDLVSCVHVATSALLQLIRVRLADAQTVRAACQSLTYIVDACRDDSAVRATICESLFGTSSAALAEGEQLPAQVVAADLSNAGIQTLAMWLTGFVYGVAPVVHQMMQSPTTDSIQLSGLRTLCLLHGERFDSDKTDIGALPAVFNCVLTAIQPFPKNIVLQHHACYAMFLIAEMGAAPFCGIRDDVFLKCASAAAESPNFGQDSSNTCCDAVYFKREATQCLTAICCARPIIGPWLRDRGLQKSLANAVRITAKSVWDGKRYTPVEETLRLKLLALTYMLGTPVVILETLRRWGWGKPAVTAAVTDAVVELGRRPMYRSATLEPHDDASAAMASPVQALCVAGCGAELLAAMREHASDADLECKFNLPFGFLESLTNLNPYFGDVKISC